MWDVGIIGGGPAGLSAALVLARARKRVVLFDAATPRNAAAGETHGYLTRDGCNLKDFHELALKEISAYGEVQVTNATVTHVESRPDGTFGLVAESLAEIGKPALDCGPVQVSRVLLACGMIDDLPPLKGLDVAWGKGVYECPYCHGWEVRDRVIGYLSPREDILDWSFFLQGWSPKIVALTSGVYPVSDDTRKRLERCEVELDERPVSSILAPDGRFSGVGFEDGAKRALGALVLRTGQRAQSLVKKLDLALTADNLVLVDEHHQTSRPGIYAAGDLCTDTQSVVIAAASGTQAAYGINHDLTLEGKPRAGSG